MVNQSLPIQKDKETNRLIILKSFPILDVGNFVQEILSEILRLLGVNKQQFNKNIRKVLWEGFNSECTI